MAMNRPRFFQFFRYLRIQITLYYFLTSLVSIMILGFVLYSSISNIFLKETLNETIEAVNANGRLLDQYLLNLKTVSAMISNDSDTVNFLQSNNPEAKNRISSRINYLINTNSDLYAVTLVSKTGDMISNQDNVTALHPENMMKEPWYANVMKNKGMPVLTSIRRQELTMDQSTWVISVGQEIVNSKGEHLGVFLIDFSYEVIASQLKSLSLGSEGEAFILTKENEVVYHRDTAYFESPTLKENLVDILKMGTGYDASMNKLTHHYLLKNANWVLVGVASLDQLAIARQQILETLVAIGISLLVIVLGSGVIIANSITRPIRLLQSSMQTFSEDLLIADVAGYACYEVEELNKHFKEMAVKIQVLMEDVVKQERYLRESEIKLLYSQINPHFLYNTLETIIWMAEFGDSENVISLTKALSQFFRIALSRGHDFIPLSQEIEHIEQYLFIQQKRYGDKLNYEINYDPEVSEVIVPKIILQPLVENAIYHGIKPVKRLGLITITCRLDASQQNLLMLIEDNGVGFDVAQQPPSQDALRLGGVGIANVVRRLQLIYNHQATLTISSHLNQGTQITISLPLRYDV